MKVYLLAAGLAISGLVGVPMSKAAVAESHPFYMHGLEDLKQAERSILSSAPRASLGPHERSAVQNIEAAQSIIYQVAPEEHKNDRKLPSADVDPSKRLSRLQDANVFLHQALDDVSRKEGDLSLDGEKKRTGEEVKAAIYEVGAAEAAAH